MESADIQNSGEETQSRYERHKDSMRGLPPERLIELVRNLVKMKKSTNEEAEVPDNLENLSTDELLELYADISTRF